MHKQRAQAQSPCAALLSPFLPAFIVSPIQAFPLCNLWPVLSAPRKALFPVQSEHPEQLALFFSQEDDWELTGPEMCP